MSRGDLGGDPPIWDKHSMKHQQRPGGQILITPSHLAPQASYKHAATRIRLVSTSAIRSWWSPGSGSPNGQVAQKGLRRFLTTRIGCGPSSALECGYTCPVCFPTAFTTLDGRPPGVAYIRATRFGPAVRPPGPPLPRHYQHWMRLEEGLLLRVEPPGLAAGKRRERGRPLATCASFQLV